MSTASIDRKEKRFLTQDSQISRRTYNLVLCGTLLYGFIINLILCITVKDVTKFIKPWIVLLLFIIFFQLGCLIVTISTNPVICFIGYNIAIIQIEVALSLAVQLYGGFSSDVVTKAFLVTVCLTGTMTVFATVRPDFFCNLGKILCIIVFALLCARIILRLFGIKCILVSWFGAITFTLCFAYDVYRSQQYPPTMSNAINCALDICTDVFELFCFLLDILSDD